MAWVRAGFNALLRGWAGSWPHEGCEWTGYGLGSICAGPLACRDFGLSGFWHSGFWVPPTYDIYIYRYFLYIRFSKLKDEDSLLIQYNLLYKINWLDYDGTYKETEQTKQHLKFRIYSIWTNNSLCSSYPASHSTNLGNDYDFFILKTLDRERHWEKWFILEMIEILNDKNSFNKSLVKDCFSNICQKFVEKHHFS